MNCEILHILYIKSNGELLCNDDFGERVLLGHIDTVHTAEDIDKLLYNEQYQHIRKSFTDGRLPWPGICEHCAFIRHDEAFSDGIAKKHIVKLQLEPTLRCNLNCLGCTNDHQVQTRNKPHTMAPETYHRFLKALQEAGYRLDSLEYCGQGEPLMHPQIGRFFSITSQVYPQAWQRVITNGNVKYSRTLQGYPVDEILVAGDGLWQESYEQYRVHGKVDKVLQFMADAVADKEKGKPVVIWKYILFEFNDSDDELRQAQEKALELGVDSLLFVVTHSANRSLRFPMEKIAELPIIIPQVATNAHPSFFDGVRQGKVRIPCWRLALDKFQNKSKARVDEVLLFPENLLQIRGWAAATIPVDRIALMLDGEKLGEVVPTDLRPDVEEVYPEFHYQPVGFRLSTRIEGTVPERGTLTIISYSSSGKILGKMRAKCTFMPYREPGMAS